MIKFIIHLRMDSEEACRLYEITLIVSQNNVTSFIGLRD